MEGNVSLCRAPFTSAKISEWHLQKVVLEPLQLGAPVPDIVAESAVSVLFFFPGLNGVLVMLESSTLICALVGSEND